MESDLEHTSAQVPTLAFAEDIRTNNTTEH